MQRRATEGETITAKGQQPHPGRSETSSENWWRSPHFWGGLGGIAGWGLSGSAIYDATVQGPEVISLNMTPVLIAYSTLFAWWSWVIIPQNLLLMSCHLANITAQCNQLRRGIEHRSATGRQDEVQRCYQTLAAGAVTSVAAVMGGPILQRMLGRTNISWVTAIAIAPAGPFTVHFWAPMSKWLISGASFLDLHRPTDRISLAQYSALTVTGFVFSRYSMVIIPLNYNLAAVNVALFVSSAWHLGRKVKADYLS